jgi:hypothetical protein
MGAFMGKVGCGFAPELSRMIGAGSTDKPANAKIRSARFPRLVAPGLPIAAPEGMDGA